MKTGKRNHKKRHGVGRERSAIDRRKHQRAMLARAAQKRLRARHLAIMRLFWSGSVPDLESAARAVDGDRLQRRTAGRRQPWNGARLAFSGRRQRIRTAVDGIQRDAIFPTPAAERAFEEGRAVGYAEGSKLRNPYDRGATMLAGWWDAGFDVGVLEVASRFDWSPAAVA